MDGFGNACLADFGLATVTQNLDSLRSAQCQQGLTVRWTAPELLNEEAYTKETDMYSFAMVMIEVCDEWFFVEFLPTGISYQNRYSLARSRSAGVQLPWQRWP